MLRNIQCKYCYRGKIIGLGGKKRDIKMAALNSSIFKNKKAVAGVISVFTVLFVVALIVFKPWLLFVDKHVDDEIPAAVAAHATMTPAQPSESEAMTPPKAQSRQGQFISHEHETSGTATLIVDADGKKKLVLTDLATSNGPDVHVWLSKAPVIPGKDGWFVAKDHEHFDAAPIKGNIGNQVYDLPDDVNFDEWTSVVLWCDDFNVSFGAAELS
ncbi:DM13 domain-containing protein [Corynebacterium diphtheriae]